MHFALLVIWVLEKWWEEGVWHTSDAVVSVAVFSVCVQGEGNGVLNKVQQMQMAFNRLLQGLQHASGDVTQVRTDGLLSALDSSHSLFCCQFLW